MSTTGQPRPLAHERQHSKHRKRDAKREGDPPDPQITGGRQRKADSAPARARPIHAKRDPLEGESGDEHRKRADETNPEQQSNQGNTRL